LSAGEEKKIRDQCLQAYEAQLRSLRGSFEEDYRKAKEELASLSNLHYALVNRETDEVFTNFQKIDPKSTDFRKLVEQYKWNETYTNIAGYHSGERVVNQSQWLSSYDYTSIRISDWFHQYDDRITLYEKEFVKSGWDVYIALNDELLPKGLDGELDIYYKLDQNFQQAKNNLPVALAMTAICLLVYMLCAIYITVASGHRAETEEITLLWTDRIPNDLHLLLSGSLVILGLAAAAGPPAQIDATQGFQKLLTLAGIGCAMGAGGVLLEWLTSVARNVKRRQFWRNTLIVKFFRFLKKSWKRFRTALHNVKEDIKAHAIPNHRMENLRTSILFLFVGYLLLNVILIGLTILCMADGPGFAWLFFTVLTILFNLIVLILFWKTVIALDEIMTAVSKTRQGDLNYPLKTEKMPRMLRKFGEDVVGMQDGMRTAVDEAIKGEHMKTELITNVSHDLKTPLTAIVNYVDLLKKCDISDATAQEYIGVLEEKSERLKHLIEDLVEASKATTGNLKLNFIKVNLYELAVQAVGENEDALEAAGLDVRLNTPEKEPILYADSQKTWRIIDNLISNVKKYALAGTRVYIEVSEDNGYGVFSIKNVSRDPLDVPVEQLTQRFVRGDASRSTEGSGLGLSIAQSLCELQKGTLAVSMDGDLFKVTVHLPLAD
uniref:sensor histidine kinase n=1 Tax=Candidatus Fimivicinus sp. TaxID=3056640 RepID=UPI003FF15820